MNPSDWQRFLSRHDMHWDRAPLAWHEGAFLGNGLLGVMVFQLGNALTFELGRSDVYDGQPAPRDDFNAVTYTHSRLPIGRLLLCPSGRMTGMQLRLELQTAQLSGTISTDRGQIRLRSYVHAIDPVLVCQAIASGGESVAWRFEHERSITPRDHPGKPPPPAYRANPDPLVDVHTAGGVCVQPLHAGGAYATAWRIAADTLVASIAFSTGGSTARSDAPSAVDQFLQRPRQQAHDAWWRRWYPRHFVGLPDARVESFYWRQIYKLGAATRPDRPAMDLLGPWYRPTRWPGYWWNVNTQVAYYPLYASNRIDLVEPLLAMTEANVANLAANVPDVPGALGLGRASGPDMRCLVESETGNLPWVLHHFWLCWAYTRDDAYLRRLFPLLKGSMNYSLHLLQEGRDGHLHLPRTTSPEYGESRDANYDLSWLRWGAATLLDMAARLGVHDPDSGKWRRVLDRLVSWPTDERGLRVGADLSYDRPHHHYSHLAMIYPLYLMNWEQPQSRDLIERSCENWRALGGWSEFSRPAAIAMDASMGRSDHVIGDLHALMDECDPNTMHNGASSPVLDGGLGLVTAVNEVLLGSWGSAITVFPAVPPEWDDVSFSRMLAQGGFEVSATRTGGRTRLVTVTSLAARPCRLRTSIPGAVRVQIEGHEETEQPTDGAISLRLAKGQTAIITPATD